MLAFTRPPSLLLVHGSSAVIWEWKEEGPGTDHVTVEAFKGGGASGQGQGKLVFLLREHNPAIL